jgi:hypothetical protein
VEPTRPTGELPLRPLTVGELLDAAVSVLRRHGWLFIGTALAFAAVEQVMLYPLRRAAGVGPPYYLPYRDRLGEYWLLLAAGLACEASIIAVLGGLTAPAAANALLGVKQRSRELAKRARFGGVVVIAVVAGLIAGLCALAGLLPWLFGYGLIGLAVPAMVIDRVGPGRGMTRSLVLAARSAMRASWIRVLGYFGWLAIRIALGLGGLALLSLVVDPGIHRWAASPASAVWACVNAVMYPALACLDAVLHLDTRIRTEGLDIALGRTTRTAEALGVPR